MSIIFCNLSPSTEVISAFIYHVVDIITLSSSEQMRGIHASAIVARMADVRLIRWNRTDEEFIRNAVRVFPSDYPVSIRIHSTAPSPTIGRFIRYNRSCHEQLS